MRQIANLRYAEWATKAELAPSRFARLLRVWHRRGSNRKRPRRIGGAVQKRVRRLFVCGGRARGRRSRRAGPPVLSRSQANESPNSVGDRAAAVRQVGVGASELAP